MRYLLLSLVTTFTTAQCARPDVDADPPAPPPQAIAPPTVAAQPPPAKSDAPAAVKVPIDGLPVFGHAAAPVTIVAFLDYECHYCRRANGTLSELRAIYGDRLRIAVASHPLPFHAR